MIDRNRILGLIPARGGSKGVPGKNLRPLAGKPLIAWTIEEAKKSRYLDRLILSSDSADIIATAGRYGCEAPFVRPAELARDDTPGVDPVLHALSLLPGYDYVALLQPTSPLRTAADIDACIERCAASGAGACVSVVETVKTPYWMYEMNADGRLASLMKNAPDYARRQDAPPVYVLNGAVYVADVLTFLDNKSFLTSDTVGYPMPPERSVDIDGLLDFRLAELLLDRNGSGEGERD